MHPFRLPQWPSGDYARVGNDKAPHSAHVRTVGNAAIQCPAVGGPLSYSLFVDPAPPAVPLSKLAGCFPYCVQLPAKTVENQSWPEHLSWATLAWLLW